MVAFRPAEMRIIEDAFGMEGGYVVDFSDRSFAVFFDREFGVDIYDEKYSFNGSSKAKRMRAFISTEDESIVSRVLRRLWEYSDEIPFFREMDRRETIREHFIAVLAKIEGNSPRTDAIDRFRASDETLEELVAAIERDIGVNRPSAALDRLHTYCMKKFGHLLDQRRIPWQKSEPLHSRVGKYVKALTQEREVRDMTAQIGRNAIGIFDKYNHVRNNQSLAHDNELLDQAEARFIYDSVTAFLRFIKSVEASRFGN
jgi:hypothetical protein